MNDHIPAEDFAAYVDGMLGPEKKSALENHFSRCPACLDELVEIVAIMRSRDKVLAESQGKIPAQFLMPVLGEKSKTTKSVLHLRLVFEIAAALVVVVFIGYLFISGNWFWQSPEQQKPSVVMDKNARLADTSTSLRDEKIAPLPAQRRDRDDAKKANNERTKTDADQGLADSFISEKRKSTVGDKGLPAASSKAVPAFAQENKLEESAAEQSRPTIEKESLQKKELARTATIPETVGAVQPIEAKQGKLKDEESLLRSSVAISETAGADQPALGDKKQDVALARKEIAGKRTIPPIRIEGDVVWTDLRNPELIFAWYWFQKGLVLELQIDGAGTVIAVVALGKIDPLLARQAENEAKKLLFSVSEKKSRRARLVAEELPPN